MLGSPPPCRAAMMMARASLLHSLPRLASMAPFLCLMVAQWECPDMAVSFVAGCSSKPLQFRLDVAVALVAFDPMPFIIHAQRLAPGVCRLLALLQPSIRIPQVVPHRRVVLPVGQFHR